MQHLAPDDPVIFHPAVTCGFHRSCRRGNDMHRRSRHFPDVDDRPGGYAELLRASVRALAESPVGTDPTRPRWPRSPKPS